jgi:hypothetical protein
MRSFLMAAILAASLTTPAHSAQRIMFDPGGILTIYIEKYNEWRRTGELVVLDGFCISACTMVLGLIRPERACATPFARLAFHSASYHDRMSGQRSFAREATRLLWHIYPHNVRALLLRRGWQDGMDHEHLIYVEGDELRSISRPCTADDLLELKGAE